MSPGAKDSDDLTLDDIAVLAVFASTAIACIFEEVDTVGTDIVVKLSAAFSPVSANPSTILHL